MLKVCCLASVQQAMSNAYHPHTDGQTDLTNRAWQDVLRQYVNPFRNDSDGHLDHLAEFAINDAWHGCNRPYVELWPAFVELADSFTCVYCS